jgi:hypothetical protein
MQDPCVCLRLRLTAFCFLRLHKKLVEPGVDQSPPVTHVSRFHSMCDLRPNTVQNKPACLVYTASEHLLALLRRGIIQIALNDQHWGLHFLHVEDRDVAEVAPQVSPR